MANPLCHFEFCSNEPEKCRQFYGQLFDWEFDSQSFAGYTLISTGSEPGGGLIKTPEHAPGPCLSVYFLVDDIPATIRRAEQAGGRAVVPETPIPNVGSFAVLSDPEGVVFGIFKGQQG